LLDDVDADDAGGADDIGCWFQKERDFVLLEEGLDGGRLDEKQTGARRLEPGMRFPEPGIRFETGGEQRMCGLEDK
jgi:hypothetical protein